MRAKKFVWLCVGVLVFSSAGSLGFAQTPAGSGSGAEDIRDIRGPVEITESASWEPLILGGLLALAIAGLAWWLIRVLMRRENRRILTARERALAELAAAHELMDPNRSREYAFAVSDALRKFVELRFRLPSTRQTSQEFLKTVSDRRGFGLGVYTPTLVDFMGYCDLGKFGKWELSRPVMTAMHASALAVVNSELSEPDSAVSSPDERSDEACFLDPVSPVPAGVR